MAKYLYFETMEASSTFSVQTEQAKSHQDPVSSLHRTEPIETHSVIVKTINRNRC